MMVVNGHYHEKLTPKVDQSSTDEKAAGRAVSNATWPGHESGKLFRRRRPGSARHRKEHQAVYTTLHFDKPWSYENYLKTGGYAALDARSSRRRSRPADVVEMVKQSGLRGRGGAGFPTGLKWSVHARRATCRSTSCAIRTNPSRAPAKDRDILRYNPHAVIEGMAIACYATGSTVGYNYLRGEFHHEPFEHLDEATRRRKPTSTAGWARTSRFGRGHRPGITTRWARAPTSAAKRPR
jgi:hypothetical protein